ncbi:MAG: glutamate--tRNA ligase [Sulfurospirillaceae bacterium]|nr:glutamate--tRNA ligase [Sulfurospirillaceae bacterium]
MFRVALSPTGDMHIETLRVALLNYICAAQAGEPLIVRIEDIDKERTIEGKEHAMLDMLSLFGISYTQLYYQSSNFKYHLQFASTLLDKKKAFICFCKKESQDKAYRYDGTCENLSSDAVLNNPNPFVIRMKKPAKTFSFNDKIKGAMRFEPDDIDSFVIMSADKYPTNTFACACDDMLQGVTTIIREEKHLLNTPKEELIRQSLGYDQAINYAHIPVMLYAKEDETLSAQYLLDQGFMPEAILNYLVLLGYDTPTEIFTLEETISWFDITRLSKSSVHFDMDKLRFINREHIKRIPDMELSKRLGYACDKIGKLAKLYTEEVSTTYEIKQKIDALFAKKAFYAEFEHESKLLQELILSAPYMENFDTFQSYLLEKSGLKENAFFKPLRFWLSGVDQGPELALLYPLIKHYLKEIVR